MQSFVRLYNLRSRQLYFVKPTGTSALEGKLFATLDEVVLHPIIARGFALSLIGRMDMKWQVALWCRRLKEMLRHQREEFLGMMNVECAYLDKVETS